MCLMPPEKRAGPIYWGDGLRILESDIQRLRPLGQS